MNYDTMTVVRDEFRADVKRAIDVLRSEGANEVYVFGSVELELAGHRWHRDLLQRMALPNENRNQVIEKELADKLLDYLGFRHRFRHSYPGRLNWNLMAALVHDLRKTHDAFRASARRLLSEFKEVT